MNEAKKKYMQKFRKGAWSRAYDKKQGKEYYEKHKEKMNRQSKENADSKPLYRTWSSMKTRCLNKNHEAYHNYGGRGIKVCDRWMKYENYIEDILKEIGPKPEGKSVDRIDNDGNYEPGNVRWATRKEQRANRREVK